MVHELGHILGMSHEQQRPDGPETFYGASEIHFFFVPAPKGVQCDKTKTFEVQTFRPFCGFFFSMLSFCIEFCISDILLSILEVKGRI